MRPTKKRWLRGVLLIGVGGVLIWWGPTGCRLVSTWFQDRPKRDQLPAGFVDDASRLNKTKITEVWNISQDPVQAEQELVQLLQRARQDKLPISIAGARHSMGGHTISPGGLIINMLPFNHMELDEKTDILTVGAGARWAQVLSYLNERGRSVAIMQASNNFTVGGSLSVNCHGWQQNRPPIASSVESLRLLRADGAVVRCSRTENQELFSLVLGGYGLFGVILDVQLRVAPNERYQPHLEIVPTNQYVQRFHKEVDGATDVGMVYGRLCVVPGEKTFLREAILAVFHRVPGPVPPLQDIGYHTLLRELYRAQIGSEDGKVMRWNWEKAAMGEMSRRVFSRNQLLNTPVELYQEQNVDRTDILHEYFIPPGQVEAFLEQARAIIPRYHGDLLNATLRNVNKDTDTLLRYAPEDVFALVMLFNQERTDEANDRMEQMTRELIKAALNCGGRYYLTYRLHATQEQFGQAYPEAALFFERKRHYDPEELFQNQFYRTYGRPGIAVR
jgi:FAD/FMN-containing dehydrogenase